MNLTLSRRRPPVRQYHYQHKHITKLAAAVQDKAQAHNETPADVCERPGSVWFFVNQR